MWDVINLIIDETKEINLNEGKSFDISSSVSQQLPHFCCINIMLDNQAQKDISQYLYCKEFSIPPYPGSYGMQPLKWIEKANVIKYAIAKRDEREYRKAKMKINKGSNNG